MFKWFWRGIWNLSEFTGVCLGRFAPFVFHKMLGRQARHISDPVDGRKKRLLISNDQFRTINEALKTQMNWLRFKIVVLALFILTAVLCLGWLWIS